MKRVVVTGIGSLSPLGNHFRASWDAAKAGRSGIAQIGRFDASGLPWELVGELKDFNPDRYLSKKESRRLDPFTHYAAAAAAMAAEDAGISLYSFPDGRGSRRDDQTLLNAAGVVIGSSRGGISTIERELLKSQCSRVTARRSFISPTLMPSTTVSMAASVVAQKLGITGYCLGISNACSSGANAIGEAFRLIKFGHARLVFAGGSEAPICRLCVEGYGNAGTLSRKRKQSGVTPSTPRPFEKARDGFVLAEGSCVLVLEDYESARERGAPLYGEIIGYGNTSDAFHITQPSPEGEAKAMMKAIKEAHLSPDDVDYVNAHGTGTPIGDLTEAQAMKMVFGKRITQIPVTATKSATGHMLAASGAFEIASTLLSMRESIIPPTINLDEKDADCDINVITAQREADIKFSISNSFGFGGVNAVIALAKI
ncbi:MAG TPA: beta-ketoacyl-[acyl-carrier-protein] synthase family protein [Thermodesulfovibrionales bacterium]|nr:beta-ketoacyl-[acyl-carrier-protein] synthase family protein [Thermodesulfovibrionales bacterium]